ncbi:MAG: hypothetical protein GKR94_34555 [Gammaproteobacteria bacterium]|nr:hypothetical protein [Gammaproteobacteria bacterium]
MHNMRGFVAALAAGMVLSFGVSAAGTGEASGSSANQSSLAEAQAAIDSGNYKSALDILEPLMDLESGNADLFNLFGYAQRKLGNVAAAFKSYRRALSLNPQHRGANEYIGELYLETDQLGRAQEHLQILDGVCLFPCEEYDELKRAIEAYRAKRS